MEAHAGDHEFVKLVTGALQSKLNRHADERLRVKDGGYFNLWRSMFANLEDELVAAMGRKGFEDKKAQLELEEYNAHLMGSPNPNATDLLNKKKRVRT